MASRVSARIVQESESHAKSSSVQNSSSSSLDVSISERKSRRQRQQATYRLIAVITSVGISAVAFTFTFLRFYWHIQGGGKPWVDMGVTLGVIAGGMYLMEIYARIAHKTIWHHKVGWILHKSHHSPRAGLFEANDLYAIINALPAMALCTYGFFTPNTLGAVCFGAGLGITIYGISYMFVHDGMVHRRFPTGPVGDLPYMKRVVAAHRLHHSGQYDGAPWGMFLGPAELDGFPGAREHLEQLVAEEDARNGTTIPATKRCD